VDSVLRRLDFVRALSAGLVAGEMFTCGPARAGGARTGGRCPHPEGGPPIDFSVLLLNGEHGERLALSSFLGSAVWLNFFATWCPPCNEEAARIVSLGARYHDAGLKIVGVDVKETQEPVRAYVAKYHIDYPVGLDSRGMVYKGLGGNGFPTHIFLDRTAHITCVAHGALTNDQMDSEIAVALASGQERPQARAAASPTPTASPSRRRR